MNTKIADMIKSQKKEVFKILSDELDCEIEDYNWEAEIDKLNHNDKAEFIQKILFKLIAKIMND
jgi:hypothetical protein